MKIVRHQHIVVGYVMLIQVVIENINGGQAHHQHLVLQVVGINQVQLHQLQIA